HNGIAYQDHYEFASLVRARFVSHPERQEIDFTMVGNHELIEGLEPFTLFEEPYQFELIGQNHEEWKVTMLMEYELSGVKYPAAWVHNHGAGKVCYFMPGHDVSIFENTMFQKVLQQLVELL
ncbi:MAG: ThuA domain-containing protein, partial [Vallitaleaceae bacterium]|nr:ThuA domain-containing protein [Vallitaleaceae bacterium]